jgi:hypothetical protein
MSILNQQEIDICELADIRGISPYWAGKRLPAIRKRATELYEIEKGIYPTMCNRGLGPCPCGHDAVNYTPLEYTFFEGDEHFLTQAMIELLIDQWVFNKWFSLPVLQFKE